MEHFGMTEAVAVAAAWVAVAWGGGAVPAVKEWWTEAAVGLAAVGMFAWLW